MFSIDKLANQLKISKNIFLNEMIFFIFKILTHLSVVIVLVTKLNTLITFLVTFRLILQGSMNKSNVSQNQISTIIEELIDEAQKIFNFMINYNYYLTIHRFIYKNNTEFKQ